jgi:hypothetical protein
MQEPRAALRFAPDEGAEADAPLDRWRWDDATRRRIRRPPPARARAVAALLAPYVLPRGPVLAPTYVETVATMDAAGEEALVRAWLRTLEPDGAQPVVLVYGRADVYWTTWAIFYQAWPDFCLPGADDLLVCPATEAWVLLYWHADEFIAGRVRRRPAAGA